MRWQQVAVMAGVGLVAIFAIQVLREQTKPVPVKSDASGVESNTATWDNSFYATSQAVAQGAFAPQIPATPNTPAGWREYQSMRTGGVIPATAGMPTVPT